MRIDAMMIRLFFFFFFLIVVDLLKKEAAAYSLQPPDRKRPRLLHGVLLMRPDGSLTIEDPEVSCP
jgi:hypothetical protein